MNRDEEPHLERSSSVQNPLSLFGVCVALLLAATFRVSAVLPTFYDGRTRLAREVLETLQGHFKHKCLEPIRHNTRLAEAPSHKKTIFEYAPTSHGAHDYNRVCDWVLSTTARTETHAQEAQVAAGGLS